MSEENIDKDELERKVRRQNRIIAVAGILLILFLFVIVWLLFPNLKVPFPL